MPKKRKIFDADNLCNLAQATHTGLVIEYGDYFFPSMNDETEDLLEKLSDSAYNELKRAMKKFVKKHEELFSELDSAHEPEETDKLWGDIQTQIERDSGLSPFLKL